MRNQGKIYAAIVLPVCMLAGFLLYSSFAAADIYTPPTCTPPNCQPKVLVGGLLDVLKKGADASQFNGPVIIGGYEGTTNYRLGVGTRTPSSVLHIVKGGFSTSARTNYLAHFGDAGTIDAGRQLLVQQWGDGQTSKQFIMGNGFITDAGPSIVNGPTARAAGFMWDDDSFDVVINSESAANTAGAVTSALTVKSDTGFVGIGTTAPANNLHIRQGGGKSGGTLFESDHYSEMHIRSDADKTAGGPHEWALITRGDTTGRFEIREIVPDKELNHFAILKGGNVGIGTTAPNKLLHLKTSSGTNAELDIQSGSKKHWGIYHDETSEELRFWNNDANRLTLTKDGTLGASKFCISADCATGWASVGQWDISGTHIYNKNTGNVGIGTTAPTRSLDLAKTGQIAFGNRVQETQERGIYWHEGNGYGIYRTAGEWTGAFQQLKIQFATGIQLGAGPGSNPPYGKSYVEIINGKGLMVSSGNVGIGTTNPQAPLDVAGRTIKLSNTYPVYRWSFGGSTDLKWKKITDITLGTGTYEGASFEVEIMNMKSNHGATTNVMPMRYYVSALRSTGADSNGVGIVNSPDSGSVSGPFPDYVRLVRTALGVYELQVRQIANYEHMEVTARALSTDGATITYIDTPVDGVTNPVDNPNLYKIYTANPTHYDYLTNAYVVGKVGIGITVPTQALHISGANPIALVKATSGEAHVRIDAAGTDDAFFAIYKAGVRKWSIGTREGSDDLRFYEDDDVTTSKMTIQNATGNVAIGTNDPTGYRLKLQFANANEITASNIPQNNKLSGIRIFNTDTTDKSGAAIEFQLGNSDTAEAAIAAIRQGNKTSALAFYTADGTTFAERMRINPSGRVVIGATDVCSPLIPKLCVDGNMIIKGDISYTGKLSGPSPSADLAELFETEETVEVGDIVAASGNNQKLKKSSKPYQSDSIGIVSGSPAILFEGSQLILGSHRYTKGKKPPIALAGRVPVKVSLENGPIELGDYLTTSSKPGIAMKATEPGATIGIALEKYSGSGDGKVLVFVNISERNSAKRLSELEERIKALELQNVENHVIPSQ